MAQGGLGTVVQLRHPQIEKRSQTITEADNAKLADLDAQLDKLKMSYSTIVHAICDDCSINNDAASPRDKEELSPKFSDQPILGFHIGHNIRRGGMSPPKRLATANLTIHSRTQGIYFPWPSKSQILVLI